MALAVGAALHTIKVCIATKTGVAVTGGASKLNWAGVAMRAGGHGG